MEKGNNSKKRVHVLTLSGEERIEDVDDGSCCGREAECMPLYTADRVGNGISRV